MRENPNNGKPARQARNQSLQKFPLCGAALFNTTPRACSFVCWASASLQQQHSNKTLTIMGTSASKPDGDGILPEQVENYLSSLEKADQNLVVLDLSNCGIDTSVACRIAQALSQHRTLQLLVLKQNPIGDLGALSIADGLRNPDCFLEKVDLSFTDIGSVGAGALGDALRGNSCLKHLLLSNNHIDKNGVDVIGSGLQENTSLQVLDLSGNGLDANAAVSLASPLACNKTLLELNLENNNLGMEGAMAIAEGLSFNTHLQRLNLRNNNVGDIGAMALAAALENNVNLKVLRLGNNNIGNEGAIAVYTAISKNNSVEELDLEHENGTSPPSSPQRNQWVSSRDAISPPR